MMPFFDLESLLWWVFVIFVAKVVYEADLAKEQAKRNTEESERFAARFLKEKP